MGDSSLLPGDVVAGKYRIERVLGEGGMGVVYAAHHELLEQPVALKALRQNALETVDAVARFLNEARSAARIKNEHVVRVMDVGVVESLGVPYMVMELLEGTDVERMLESNGPLPVNIAALYVLQALEAVAEAHAMGIVHRDLKPANLFVQRGEDGEDRLKVLDFGISKSIGGLALSAHAAATSTKQLLGTPAYMSPEQLRSSKSIDGRCDIWAVGIILFQMTTGGLPFSGETIGDLFASIFEGPAMRVRARRADAPPLFDDIVARCLERKPEHRFANVGELAHALAPLAGPAGGASLARIRRSLTRGLYATQDSVPVIVEGPVAASPDASGPILSLMGTDATWSTTLARSNARTAALVVAIVAAVALTMAVGGVMLWRNRSPTMARTVASAAASDAPPVPLAPQSSPDDPTAPPTAAPSSVTPAVAPPVGVPSPDVTPVASTPPTTTASAPRRAPSASPRRVAPATRPATPSAPATAVLDHQRE